MANTQAAPTDRVHNAGYLMCGPGWASCLTSQTLRLFIHQIGILVICRKDDEFRVAATGTDTEEDSLR